MGKYRKWTKADEQYLIDNWGTLSITTIMKNLDRTRNAIKVKSGVETLWIRQESEGQIKFA